MNAPNCQPELQQSRIARLRYFENIGDMIKRAHRLANREKTANFWRREDV